MFEGDEIRRKRKASKLSAQGLADLLNVEKHNVYKWEKGHKPNDPEEYLRLESWLSGKVENVPRGTKPPPKLKLGIPIYEGSIVKMDNKMELHEYELEGPDFFIQIPQYRDCDLGARASGDKMYPEIRNGDLLICKRVHDHDTVMFGDIYLLVLKGGLQTVNYIHPGESDEYFLLKNRNESAPPTPMLKSKVAMIYKVRGVFKGY